MELSKLAKIFKALSCEQRLKIFQMLYNFERSGSCCTVVEKGFSKACDVMHISKSTVSHHFKELENAGLIICDKRGQKGFCKVNEKVIKEVKKFLK